jgi:hypothetical protein
MSKKSPKNREKRKQMVTTAGIKIEIEVFD